MVMDYQRSSVWGLKLIACMITAGIKRNVLTKPMNKNVNNTIVFFFYFTIACVSVPEIVYKNEERRYHCWRPDLILFFIFLKNS